jgi:hypothetical protein
MLHRIMDRRVNLYQRPIANDRYAPSAWDDEGITAALERDARGYEMIAMVGSALVLLLGIVSLGGAVTAPRTHYAVEVLYGTVVSAAVREPGGPRCLHWPFPSSNAK